MSLTFPSWRRRSASAVKAGVAMSERAICLVMAHPKTHQDPYGLSLIKCAPARTLSERIAVLQRWTSEAELGSVSVTLTLEEDAIEIFQVEKPDVPESDLKAAVHWKLQEYLDYPVTEAISDVMPAPPDRHGQASGLYVAVVKKNLLQERLSMIRDAGMEPESIGITQLASRNLVQHRLQCSDIVGVLNILAESSRICICDNNGYYFTRTLPLGSAQLNTQDLNDRLELVEQLVLELQRTLDYFDSRFGQVPVKKIFMFLNLSALDWLVDEVSDLLGTPCEAVATFEETSSEPEEGAELIPSAWGGLLGRLAL